MLKMSKLLAGAIGAAAAVFCSTGALAEAKGSVFGDFRYGWTHFDDDGFTTGESDLGDHGSYFGIKASTGTGDITAFGTYSRVMDTDDCINFVTGFGLSTTSLCQGGTDYTREAFAGIATPYGTLAYGTQETAYSQAARRHDPFFNTGASASLGIVGLPGFGGSHGVSILSLPLYTLAFVGNQLNYTSPNLFGATVNVAYFSNEDAGATEDPDYGIGATYSIAGIRAEAQHLRIRSGLASSVPNFLLGAGTEVDATVLSVGYAHNRFGVGLTAERLDDRLTGSPDADSLQLAGWFGLMQGTRVALALSQTNEIAEGRSVTVGVFHDITEGFTAHVAAMRLEGDADNFVADSEAFTVGASYKFELGFMSR
jgi:hypothetical protein